jgi:Spy/CpxP family protein refolding chaperone
MLRKVTLTVLTLALFGMTPAYADAPGAADPIREALTPPDVALKHARELGLSDDQVKTIQTDALDAQQQFVKLQFEMRDAGDRLAKTLRESRVDQARALEQLDAVLKLEREVKHIQLTLMIQVKNALTPEQQAAARRYPSDDQK